LRKKSPSNFSRGNKCFLFGFKPKFECIVRLDSAHTCEFLLSRRDMFSNEESKLVTLFGSKDKVRAFNRLEDEADRIEWVSSLPVVQNMLGHLAKSEEEEKGKSEAEAKRFR